MEKGSNYYYCDVGEDSWEPLGLQGGSTSPFWRRSALGFLWKRMILKLKLQYFGHLMQRVDSLENTSMLGGIGGQEEKGTTEDEMAGCHHWLDGHEFEWTLGIGDGQGGLACCNSRGRKESDMTERLNWLTDWIFRCVCVPQLSYPFTCWWTSRLLPCPDYCKQCCDEHWCLFQFWFLRCVCPPVGLLGCMAVLFPVF